jgi:hypothetical protein
MTGAVYLSLRDFLMSRIVVRVDRAQIVCTATFSLENAEASRSLGGDST